MGRKVFLSFFSQGKRDHRNELGSRSALCISMCSRECSLCSVGFAGRNLCPSSREFHFRRPAIWGSTIPSVLRRLTGPRMCLELFWNVGMRRTLIVRGIRWIFRPLMPVIERDESKFQLNSTIHKNSKETSSTPDSRFMKENRPMSHGQTLIRLFMIVQFRKTHRKKSSPPHLLSGKFFSPSLELKNLRRNYFLIRALSDTHWEHVLAHSWEACSRGPRLSSQEISVGLSANSWAHFHWRRSVCVGREPIFYNIFGEQIPDQKIVAHENFRAREIFIPFMKFFGGF